MKPNPHIHKALALINGNPVIIGHQLVTFTKYISDEYKEAAPAIVNLYHESLHLNKMTPKGLHVWSYTCGTIVRGIILWDEIEIANQQSQTTL